MSYKLSLDAIRDKFKFTSSIRHNPKTELELLPYNTKFKDNQYDFREVTGEFIRLIGQKQLNEKETVNTDELINNVLDAIEFEKPPQRSEFKQMLKTLFVDENNQLYLFHPQTLYYINTVENENKKLATFLFNVLWMNEEPWSMDNDVTHSDLMSALLFKSLPQLSTSTKRPKNYSNIIPTISDLFIKDFKWLATKSDLFTNQIEKIISYYYFLYVSQFARRNEILFKPIEQEIQPVYFTFEGEERLSKTRVSYEFGWKSIERAINQTFAHVNFLKMINFTESTSSDSKNNDLLSYQQIANQVESMSTEEQLELEQQVEQLIEEYKENLSGDIKWELLGTFHASSNIPVLKKLDSFFHIIDYQFNQSSRAKPYNEFKQWFVHFCQKSFLKSRGRSGKMLILDTDYLLFLTKLMIKDEPKIRLKNLFSEFETRGMIFDRDTQTAIVDYFEKLNLLEKKSDSGDAIYVKAFL
ncbi:DNA phosphorothioation-dependent restriction protein DptG [Paenibacillus campi]|uniref:DNA phosphorothioation-dependent restriction protein DptG n=1 Tax=Paenibacillus campi TaxID=3106031 RepID=UPI002AFFFE4F|nr:DNA phosphorothioation-dependent restriction protein DptG [Paenibacillus sp. SGZ-1009]